MPDIIIPCPAPNREDYDSDEAWVKALETAEHAAMRAMSAKLRQIRRKVYMRRRRARDAKLREWFTSVKPLVAECVTQQHVGSLTPENAAWLRDHADRLKKAAALERAAAQKRDYMRQRRAKSPAPQPAQPVEN